MYMFPPSPDAWLEKMKHFGYKVFEGPFNLNIVGWRYWDGKPNEYCDYIAAYWRNKDEPWQEWFWQATTRPGKPWLLNPANPKGAAILKPGQYLNVYELSKYKGYKALKQVRPVIVFRDNNRDGHFDQETASIEQGLFGLHIHKAGLKSKLVGVSSAGCQVFQNSTDFAQLIGLCEQAERLYGNSFSYTLLEF